jgi:hypothetical protein
MAASADHSGNPGHAGAALRIGCRAAESLWRPVDSATLPGRQLAGQNAGPNRFSPLGWPRRSEWFLKRWLMALGGAILPGLNHRERSKSLSAMTPEQIDDRLSRELTHLATKEQVADFRTEMHQAFGGFKTEIRNDFGNFKADLIKTIWITQLSMAGLIIAVVGIINGATFFLLHK